LAKTFSLASSLWKYVKLKEFRRFFPQCEIFPFWQQILAVTLHDLPDFTISIYFRRSVFYGVQLKCNQAFI